jgi:hypothetical protein
MFSEAAITFPNTLHSMMYGALMMEFIGQKLAMHHGMSAFGFHQLFTEIECG